MADVRVLIVDENPMIVGLLRQAIAPIANVESAPDGNDALAKIKAAPPDLVISDYRIPGMDGRKLLESARAEKATAKLPFILLASKPDIAERLKPLQEQVEDFVEKPFFVKEAMVRIKRVIDKINLEKMAREGQAADGTLRGTLAQMSCIDLLQSLELGHKSCQVVLTNGGDRCEMYFSDGNLSDAVYGAIVGDDAVYKVLSWTAGNFQIDFNGHSDKQTTTRSTQGLLMEGLRLIDEANRDSEEENVLDV